jgi:hypothetical protein
MPINAHDVQLHYTMKVQSSFIQKVTWYCFWEMEGMILLLHFHSALVPFNIFLICEQHDCYIHLVERDILFCPFHVFLQNFFTGYWLDNYQLLKEVPSQAVQEWNIKHIEKHLWNIHSILKNRVLIGVQDSNFITLSVQGSLHKGNSMRPLNRWKGIKCEGSEVLIVVVMKTSILWDIMPCSVLKVNWHLRRTCHHHLQGWRISQAWNQH